MISVIIPVYNRPAETREILESLSRQTLPGFEVVVIEDGSVVDSRTVVEEFRSRLNIRYLTKPNGGPGPARNFGAAHATGDFFVFLDSDCLVPPEYMQNVIRAVYEQGVEVFGGPDSASPDFSPMQKAVSYSMTSFFTTGGIRGGKKKLDRFFPRSFNMGISRAWFERVGGFSPMRFGEDIDISLRLIAEGALPVLLRDAVVCHKRRTSMRAFFRQVFYSGTARISLNIRHPHSMKAVHVLPALFTVGSVLLITAALWSWWCLLPLGMVALVWFIDAALRNRSIRVGWLSIWTSFVQLYGYGVGFLYSAWMRYAMHRSEEAVSHTRFF